jgi:predicted nucleic acid-binding protein
MLIVVDTSVIMAVIANEPIKAMLIDLTDEATLVAPASLHWEMGNAISAMFKKGLLSIEQAKAAIAAYEKIPIAFKLDFVHFAVSRTLRFQCI